MGQHNRTKTQPNKDSKTGSSETAFERAVYCYDLVNKWIENADNKVSVSSGIFTGVFGVVSFLSQGIPVGIVMNEFWHWIYRISFVVSLLLFGVSLFMYVMSINPNLGKSGHNKGTKSLKRYPVYYGDVVDYKDIDAYKRRIVKATENEFIDEVLTETHYNSHVCMNKIRRFRFGVWLSFVSVVFALICWLAKFLMYR